MFNFFLFKDKDSVTTTEEKDPSTYSLRHTDARLDRIRKFVETTKQAQQNLLAGQEDSNSREPVAWETRSIPESLSEASTTDSDGKQSVGPLN